MKFPINLAIKIVEMLIPDEYIGEVLESATEYILYPRFKDDDEWSDDEAYGVSKKLDAYESLAAKRLFYAMIRSSGNETRTSKKAYISRTMEFEIKTDNQTGTNYVGDLEVIKYLKGLDYSLSKRNNPKILRIDNMEFDYLFIQHIVEAAE